MTTLSNINYFKELPFLMYLLTNQRQNTYERVIPFYERLSVIKTDQAFSGYARSYKVEIAERNDPIVQLEASKLSIKNLFDNLTNEIEGFKYQITLKILLKKYKPDGEIEFTPVYFNSQTKLVIELN